MRRATVVISAALVGAAAIVGGTASRPARAGDDVVASNERCATRVAIALTGKGPDATLIASANPQSAAAAFLTGPDFIEKLATFTNSAMNDMPGATPEEDSAYYLSKEILTTGKPWKDLFLGQYNVDLDVNKKVVVTADPNGLGYFRSMPWLRRYAGNEPAGIKISTAYRMMTNTVGLTLVASTNAPGADISATGRKAAPCNGCHYNPWFALDHVASVLTTRVGPAAKATFTPPTAGPQSLLGGAVTVSSDKELVTALVNSPQFDVHSCRLVFRFLYGREENSCEGVVFDKCVDTLRTKGTIQAAISAVVTDPSFCQ